MADISVLGAGSWGTALAAGLYRKSDEEGNWVDLEGRRVVKK